MDHGMMMMMMAHRYTTVGIRGLDGCVLFVGFAGF
jgi:hypothetical protein